MRRCVESYHTVQGNTQRVEQSLVNVNICKIFVCACIIQYNIQVYFTMHKSSGSECGTATSLKTAIFSQRGLTYVLLVPGFFYLLYVKNEYCCKRPPMRPVRVRLRYKQRRAYTVMTNLLFVKCTIHCSFAHLYNTCLKCTVLIHQGRVGRGGELTRETVTGAIVHKSGWK
jgi:hypothetical protein